MLYQWIIYIIQISFSLYIYLYLLVSFIPIFFFFYNLLIKQIISCHIERVFFFFFFDKTLALKEIDFSII